MLKVTFKNHFGITLVADMYEPKEYQGLLPAIACCGPYSAVLMIHGENAHSRYFSEDSYKNMTEGSKYADNKELMIVPNAVHCDLYDNLEKIPFDKIENFFKTYLR